MYVCMSMYVCVYVCMYACMYVSMYVCIYVSMYLCIYLCAYVCMCTRMYVCTYVRTHTSVHRLLLLLLTSQGGIIVQDIAIRIVGPDLEERSVVVTVPELWVLDVQAGLELDGGGVPVLDGLLGGAQHL